MKKFLNVLLVITMLACLFGCTTDEPLPLPEISEGVRGDLGIDKNINEETIDKYLNRKDSVYRDMRMLIDDADYEAIGGDSYLSGFVKGFEVVPYPYLCNVEGLPEAVGSSYTGVTLFSHIDDEYVANYAESMDLLEELFPKDKVIFLMCGGGGYAGMTKTLLVNLGWDETKIYNVGGYWYYQGDNNVEVKKEENGIVDYDFDKVNYHDIDFSALTKIKESGSDSNKTVDENVEESNFIKLENVEELNKLEENKETFPLFVYLSGCTTCAEFFPIVAKWSNDNSIQMYSIELDSIWGIKNSVTDRIKYAPSMFIYENGEVIEYLESSNGDDYDYYKSSEKLNEWFIENIDISTFKTISE